MNPRLRRLVMDAQLMRTEFAGHPHIRVEPFGFDPPEQYRVTFALRGVAIYPTTGQPAVYEQHEALITLTAGYPREKPYSVMTTPIFHPNFGANVGDEICIGDFWTPAQTLPDIVVKIGAMIQFQLYNVRSPLNAVAARWVAQNESIFPIGNVELFQAEPEVALTVEAADPTATTE
jgi:ubiquitin-protein ligase